MLVLVRFFVLFVRLVRHPRERREPGRAVEPSHTNSPRPRSPNFTLFVLVFRAPPDLELEHYLVHELVSAKTRRPDAVFKHRASDLSRLVPSSRARHHAPDSHRRPPARARPRVARARPSRRVAAPLPSLSRRLPPPQRARAARARRHHPAIDDRHPRARAPGVSRYRARPTTPLIQNPTDRVPRARVLVASRRSDRPRRSNRARARRRRRASITAPRGGAARDVRGRSASRGRSVGRRFIAACTRASYGVRVGTLRRPRASSSSIARRVRSRRRRRRRRAIEVRRRRSIDAAYFASRAGGAIARRRAIGSRRRETTTRDGDDDDDARRGRERRDDARRRAMRATRDGATRDARDGATRDGGERGEDDVR